MSVQCTEHFPDRRLIQAYKNGCQHATSSTVKLHCHCIKRRFWEPHLDRFAAERCPLSLHLPQSPSSTSHKPTRHGVEGHPTHGKAEKLLHQPKCRVRAEAKVEAHHLSTSCACPREPASGSEAPSANLRAIFHLLTGSRYPVLTFYLL